MAGKRHHSKRFPPGSSSFSDIASKEKATTGFTGFTLAKLGLEEPDWLRPAASDAQPPSENSGAPPRDFSPPQDPIPSESTSSGVPAPTRTLLEGMKVVCICKGIKKSTFWKVLDTGADTKDEINRLTGAGSGGCHGRRCGPRIIEMLRGLSQ